MNSAIYQITNTLNNKCYIGSSSAVKERLLKHKWLLSRNQHHSIKLQNSVNKYGIDSFNFEVIEIVEPNNLLVREQFYIDKNNPEYNILKIAGSTIGSKRSEETKLKMSLALKGKKRTPEQIERITLGNIGKRHTEETKRKISLVQTGRYFTRGKHLKSVDMLDKDNNIIKTFKSIRDASRETGANRVSIGYVCKGISKTAGSYKWRYSND